jgi:hypothetical protein
VEVSDTWVFFDICREIILGEPHHLGGESLK